MPTPTERYARKSEAEAYIEERTFYSAETENNLPVRTYHVRRVNTGGGWGYQVMMEVVATQAAEDVLGREALPGEGPRALWDGLWR